MMWIALALLVTLAGVEAALALMRDMLIADKQALIQSLATVQRRTCRRLGAADSDRRPDAARLHPAVRAGLRRHPARVADPFVAAPSAACCFAALVSALSLLRVLGNMARRMSRVLITLYDVVIVVPLLVERLWKGMSLRRNAVDVDAIPTHPRRARGR